MIVKKIEIDWNPDLSIYASEPFLKAVGDEYGWIGGFDDDGQLRCVLPYTVIRKPFIRMVRFRVETIPVGDGFDVQEEKKFLNHAVEYFRSNGMDMVIPATTNTIFRTYPDSAVAAPYGSYIIDLCQPEEILWKNLHSKHRNVVRKAMKEGVKIKSGIDQLNTAYKLVRDTLKRSKLKFMSYGAFTRFIQHIENNVKIYIAEYQGVAQGCAVVPFSGHSAYYLYGGSIARPITGGNNFLQWEAIRQFRALGVKRYDFVGVRIKPEKGSKQEGLMMFKQRFGGQLSQGYIWKYPINPLKFACYSKAVLLLRGGDIVDNEKHTLAYL